LVRRDHLQPPRGHVALRNRPRARAAGPGPDENFFDLGGHSLLTVQVQGRLKRRLSRQVALTDLLRFPIIRTLAQLLAIDVGEQEKSQASSLDSQTDARS